MKKIFLITCLFAFALASCEDLTDLNENPKATEEVPYSALFSSAQVSLADIITETNVNYNVFRLYAQQWTQVTYTDESNYDIITRSIPDNFWNEIYLDVLRDLMEADTVIETVDPIYLGAEQKSNEKAAIDITSVYAWSVLIQVYGDVPYTEALNVQNLLPAYTSGEEIHADLINRLNADIAALEANMDAPTFPGSDLLFGGDTEQWLRFANSLKLRLGMLIADSDEGLARSIVESVDQDMLIDENQFNAAFEYVSSPPNTNPVWESLVQSGRNDYVPANTIVDIMNELDDPRRDDYFTQLNGAYIGDEYGTGTSFASVSHIADRLAEPDYPGMLLSAAEVNFFLAEAAARGWNVSGTATDYYNTAVRQSIIQYGNSEAEAEAYLAQPGVALPSNSWSDQEVQRKIGTQSWLALYNRGLEAWTQWRRIDYPTFNIAPQIDSYEDIPTRFTYPVTEQNLNTANYNVAADRIGGDLQTTNLFWDETQGIGQE